LSKFERSYYSEISKQKTDEIMLQEIQLQNIITASYCTIDLLYKRYPNVSAHSQLHEHKE